MQGDDVAFRGAVPQFHPDALAGRQLVNAFHYMPVPCAGKGVTTFQRREGIDSLQLQSQQFKGVAMFRQQGREQAIKAETQVFRITPGTGKSGRRRSVKAGGPRARVSSGAPPP